jgi:septal ring-binding cell division protein DamX
LGDFLVERKGNGLRKFMIMAMVLAMTLVVAIPALAQVSQEKEQETESGDVDQSFEATSEGDNSSQCANVQGTAQTGNSQNQLDLLQYDSEADDFEFEEVGSTIEESPTNTATCDQQVNQAASASG